ncbi:CPBP family intramembrane glutamic endopeptidase [Nocardiopsis potens]|uniref:CPBP family intramembrane glutamic endopeptidase n=1 Tax=Nocardiopsis potens TaxID=1246458 RepID=UPI00034A7E5D|nr:CPBP family intramembrane glutamic endopeptidase [Nocardiopsis potens]
MPPSGTEPAAAAAPPSAPPGGLPGAVVFSVLAAALAWAAASPLWLGGQGLEHPQNRLFIQVMMATPAAAAIIVLSASGGRRGLLRTTGVLPLRPLRPLLGYCLAGLVLSPLIMGGGILLAALAGGYRPDLTDFSAFREFAEPLGLASAEGSGVPLGALGALLGLQSLGLLAGLPMFLGEELGWRGYLLPALMPLGTWPALLVHGAVWGVWHAPVILLGYNFGRTDLAGVGLMTVWCVLFGLVLGLLRLASGSVWPAVLCHGALNSSTMMVVVFGDADAGLVGSDALPLGVWIGACTVIAALIAVGALALRARPASAAGR